jgi:hypothetical protein
MNVHWMVLYKIYVFYSDMKFKMAATAGLSLTLDPMGKMVFSPYGSVLILWLVVAAILDFRLHVQSVHITTNPMSLNPAHGKMYSIQLYMIHFFQWIAVWLVWKSTCHNKTRTLQYNICLNFLIALRKSKINRAISASQICPSIGTHWPLLSWSIGSWISDYMCNQCLSPLTLWAWIPLMAKCTRYNFIWYIFSQLPIDHDNNGQWVPIDGHMTCNAYQTGWYGSCERVPVIIKHDRLVVGFPTTCASSANHH